MRFFGIISVVLLYLFPACYSLIQGGSSQLCHRRLLTTRFASVYKGESIAAFEELKVPTNKGIFFVDLSEDVRRIVKESGVTEGTVNILSRHTTTSITINEMEGRLVDDSRQFLLKLVPPDYPYLHNDLHLRQGPPGWPGGDEAWRNLEPINAHSHLINMILGNSETVPIHNGEIQIGTWQSIILVELDGPRTRSIAVQVNGIKA